MNNRQSTSLIIKEVTEDKEMLQFVRFPDLLFRGNAYYVPQLYKNQLNTLSKEKNPAFSHCQARYWLACIGDKPVGRIAGIINHRYNQEQDVKYMRFGWLDFVEDQKVLEMLLQKVEQWAHSEGLACVHGPLGFTSFDPSGVLVEGFDELSTAWGRYNHPYYKPMLEKAGYHKDVDWIESNIKVPVEKEQREVRVAQLIKQRYGLRNAPIVKREDIGVYAEQMFDIVNQVYEGLHAFSTLDKKQVESLIADFIPLVHPDFVSVILNGQDDMVGFGVVIPSLSKALQKCRGRWFPFGWFHFFQALKHNDRVDMLLIGVIPAYRRKGVHALIFEKIIGSLQQKGIKEVETTRELEDNKEVQKLWEGYESRQHKRVRCFIKQIS